MTRTQLLTVVATSLLVAACAVEAPDESSESPPVEQRVSAAGLQIEQAERQLDRGSDPRQALVQLRAALADPAVTGAERRSAVLALSRAHEAAGETDQAIAVIEAELADHADDRAWEGESFKRRLRALLTGAETAPGAAMQRPS